MKKNLLLLGALAAVVAVLFVIMSNLGKPTDTANRSNVQFQAKDIQGQNVQVGPDKTTVLFFMAAWCSSCYELESDLKEIAKNPDVQVITIDVDAQQDTKEDLTKVQQTYGGSWPHVLDSGSNLLKQFQVNSLDTIIIVKDGKIVHRSIKPSLQTMQEVIHG